MINKNLLVVALTCVTLGLQAKEVANMTVDGDGRLGGYIQDSSRNFDYSSAVVTLEPTTASTHEALIKAYQEATNELHQVAADFNNARAEISKKHLSQGMKEAHAKQRRAANDLEEFHAANKILNIQPLNK